MNSGTDSDRTGLSPSTVFALAATAAFTGVANATVISTPAGLNPGDHFTVVLVTAASYTATSNDITTYDALVNKEASGAGLSTYGGQAVTWKTLGSTQTVDAISRFNPTVGIYRLDGAQVATSGSDLWDGTLENPISINTNGVDPGDAVVFTGTGTDGHVAPLSLGNPGDTKALGDTSGETDGGLSHLTISTWTNYSDYATTESHLLYAFSNELVATPEPTALGSLALAASIAATARRRGKASA